MSPSTAFIQFHPGLSASINFFYIFINNIVIFRYKRLFISLFSRIKLTQLLYPFLCTLSPIHTIIIFLLKTPAISHRFPAIHPRVPIVPWLSGKFMMSNKLANRITVSASGREATAPTDFPRLLASNWHLPVELTSSYPRLRLNRNYSHIRFFSEPARHRACKGLMVDFHFFLLSFPIPVCPVKTGWIFFKLLKIHFFFFLLQPLLRGFILGKIVKFFSTS